MSSTLPAQGAAKLHGEKPLPRAPCPPRRAARCAPRDRLCKQPAPAGKGPPGVWGPWGQTAGAEWTGQGRLEASACSQQSGGRVDGALDWGVLWDPRLGSAEPENYLL